MIKHYIYVYTADKTNERIALLVNDRELFKKEIDDLREEYKLSTHILYTDADTVESIVLFDPFFDNIDFHRDINIFSEKITMMKAESLPTSVEFSGSLLSRKPLDKLQLQKNLYLIYSICLDQGQKIFNSSPLAYRYGPVFEDVFQKYKEYEKYEKISEEHSIIDMLSLSKTMDINKVFPIVNNVLQLTEEKTGGNLIDITHAHKGPWDQVYIRGANIPIDDETIKKHNHHVLNKLSQPI